MLEQPRRKSEPVSAKRFNMTTAPAIPPATATLTTLPEWRDLAVHAEEMRSVHLRSLFEADATRGTRLVAEAAGLYMDFSKHRVRSETLERLFALARATRLTERIEQMFRGERINVTENRPVLHVALRPTSPIAFAPERGRASPESASERP
jgi:glucose-6-phosphate isomerase